MTKNNYKIIIMLSYLFCHLSWASDMEYPYDTVEKAGDITKCYHGVFDQDFPLKLQVGLDRGFRPDQKKILDQALEIYMDRALKSRVIDCAYARSHKDLPSSPEKFKAQVFDALRPLYIDEVIQMPSFAFIAMYENDPNSVGLGYINLFNDTDNPLPSFTTRHYLHVALNSDYLGGSTEYYYKNNAEYWAGVIGHEFLHNLGYRHPSGYPGSFIKEYGHCIQTNGLERDLPNGHGDLEVHPTITECG